jgi:thiol-disulfide isomerase/thioredoxin
MPDEAYFCILKFDKQHASKDISGFKNLTMKSIRSFIIISLTLLCAISLSAQGIEFFHGTWPEALEKAKSEEKLIFVDAFASWCGPCKRMSSQTFPDPKAGEFFNANFINVKIDMEKPENSEFAGKYPVGSYPTLMFIDAAGKVVLKDIGAKSVDQLLETGQKALGKNDRSVDFEKKYLDGDRDPKMLFDYVRSLNAAGKPSLKITNEYLNTQKDLTTEFNLKFILEGAIEADSRVFDLLLKNRDKVVAVSSEEAVNARVEKACKNTVDKAIEFKNKTLLDESKAKMKTGNSSRATAFAYEADMNYAKAVKDPGMFLKTAKTYQKTEVKNNAAKLHDLVLSLIRAFPEDKKVLKQAESWARTAAENGGLAEYWMTLAGVYKMQGNKAKARSTAEFAKKELTEKDAMLKEKIQYFLDSLEG